MRVWSWPETTVPVARRAAARKCDDTLRMAPLGQQLLELVGMHLRDLEPLCMHTRHYKAHIMFRTLRRLIYPINPSARNPASNPSPPLTATALHRQTAWTPRNPRFLPRPRAAGSPDSSPLRAQQAVMSAPFPSPSRSAIPTSTPIPTRRQLACCGRARASVGPRAG
jgi:hypothetical protein